MPISVEVLAINQQCPITFQKSDGDIVITNEIYHPDLSGRYIDRYHFFSSIPGILYTLIEKGDIFTDTKEIFQIERDPAVINYYPFWVENEKYKSDILKIRIDRSYLAEFIVILKLLMSSTPQKMLAVHFGVQGSYVETVFGTISLERFLDMLNQDELLTNVIYIIKESIYPNHNQTYDVALQE